MDAEKKNRYFSTFEIVLWLVSMLCILIAYIIFKYDNLLTLVASFIGATFLILNAKGNVWGQVLTVVFSILYGVISYEQAYYGEMITYLGMTGPIALLAVFTWLKNPANAKSDKNTDSKESNIKTHNEVKVNLLNLKEYIFLAVLSLVVTFVFYFILKALNTSVLGFSTLSVLTSFLASYLTMRRSEYYAIFYALNDVVLVILWSIAAKNDVASVSMIICFCIFFINDMYGFFSWQKMKKRQQDSL